MKPQAEGKAHQPSPKMSASELLTNTHVTPSDSESKIFNNSANVYAVGVHLVNRTTAYCRHNTHVCLSVCNKV